VTPRVIALCVLLPVYGNFTALLVGTAVPVGPWPGVGLGLALVPIVLAWARWVDRSTPQELGLTPGARLLPSAAIGLVIALAAAVPALLFLRFPPLVGQPIEFVPLGSLPRDALLWRTLVWMPLDTAIPEEIAFRGVLLATLRHRFGTRPAVLLMALVFTLWHLVVVSGTVALTNLQSVPLLAALGLIGAFVAVGLGGVFFAWLRLATGHLAASVAAHWAFNGVLLLGLGSGL
jgi:membrane protease YdiL (CAAX protease family)